MIGPVECEVIRGKHKRGMSPEAIAREHHLPEQTIRMILALAPNDRRDR